MQKMNCWEYKKCGRQKGGENVLSLGVCGASTETSTDGVNSGRNGGRICWLVSGTFCKGEVQGSFAMKKTTCLSCDFYKLVKQEEGANFRLTVSEYNQEAI